MDPVNVILIVVVLGLLTSLILIGVLGQEALGQFSLVGDELERQILIVQDDLQSKIGNLLTILQTLGDAAVSIVTSWGQQVGDGLASANDFMKNSFSQGIDSVTQQSLSAVSNVTSLSVKGVLNIISSISAVITGASTATTAAYAFVVKGLSAFAIFLIDVVTAGILYILTYVGIFIDALQVAIQAAINALAVVLNVILCAACFPCCNIPGVSCFASNLSGASCCDVSGCGHCGPGQFNVCDSL